MSLFPGYRVTLPLALWRKGMSETERGGLLLGIGSRYGARVEHYTTPGPLDLCTPGMFMLLDPCHEQQLHASDLSYLGFWHSHPPGTPSEYSPEDLISWQHIATEMFPQLPETQTHLLFPIITGDRLRCWVLSRDLTVIELEVTHGP